MPKLKRVKSSYASGVAPCPVKIEGSKSLNKTELLAEYNALLIVMAAFVEQNEGRILISRDAFDTVKRKGRVLQIKPGSDMTLFVQFDTFQEKEQKLSEPEDTNFLASSVAQEAREFLAKQRETNDSK